MFNLDIILMEPYQEHKKEEVIITLLKKRDLIQVAARGFFIQSMFTMRDKLRSGFGFMLLPGLKKLTQDKNERHKLMLKHTEFFNSHPFLSSYIAGAVLRLEETALNEPESTDKNIDSLKNRLAGVLGSLGDRLFWKFLKPAASVIALVIIFTFGDTNKSGITAGIIIFLLIFNIVHVYYRFHGVIRGYKAGNDVIRESGILIIEKLNNWILCATLLFLGILTVLECRIAFEEKYFGIFIFLSAAVLSFSFNRKSLPGLSIFTGLLAAMLLFILRQAIIG